MRCPKCGTEMPEGTLYCEKCGEEIHIVPDYDPNLDLNIDNALEKIGNQIESQIENQTKRNSRRGEKTQETVTSGESKRGFYFLLSGLLGLGILVVVMIFISWRSLMRYNSFDYQIEQAEKYRSIGEYGNAILCYGRAIEIEGEDITLLGKMADLYFLQNDQSHYEECLRKIMNAEEVPADMLRQVRERMIVLLKKKGEFQEISKLLYESGDGELSEKYKEFTAPAPVFSIEAGSYEGMQSLRIQCDGEGTIYYTLDGTVPGENSTEYTLPLILDYGITYVRACLINEYGVKSRIAEAEYQVERPLEIPQ